MSYIVFAPFRDPALASNDRSRSRLESLRVSRWVGQQNFHALEKLGDTLAFFDEWAARAALVEQPPRIGFVFAGHGSEDALFDVDDAPVLDCNRALLWVHKWGHAIACRAGTELAGAVVASKWDCFVGYHAPLIVEFDPRSLPTSLADLLAAVVTQTSIELARGNYDQGAIQSAIQPPLDALVLWLDEVDEPLDNDWAVRAFAESLKRLLVVRRPVEEQ